MSNPVFGYRGMNNIAVQRYKNFVTKNKILKKFFLGVFLSVWTTIIKDPNLVPIILSPNHKNILNMDESNSQMVLVSEFLGTKNINYFIVTFVDTEVEVDGELHVTQFNTRLITKSNKERYEKSIGKGINVRMNTTPRD